MSKELSFREALARQGETKVDDRSKSGSRRSLLLRSTDAFSRPVEAARALTRHGVGLKEAHRVVDHLADGDAYALAVAADQANALVHDLGQLGVTARDILRPKVDVKDIRLSFGLSQAQFAARFGLGLRTIQNWEQDRHELDSATAVLLAVIRDCPDAVERVLTGSPASAGENKRPVRSRRTVGVDD